MFKIIKSEARNILLPNYKYFLLPTVLFMLSNAVAFLILNVLTNNYIWGNFNPALKLLITLLFLFAEFVFGPLSLAVLFRVSAFFCNNSSEDIKSYIKDFLNATSIKRIVLINLLPGGLTVLYNINDAENSGFNIFRLEGIALLILMLFSHFINYKFFLCNYHFALNGLSAKETIAASFKNMKKKYLKYILLNISFIHWEILTIIIYALLKYIICFDNSHSLILAISTSTPYLDIFYPFWFGLGLYVIPYMYVTFSLFAKNILIGK